MSLTQTVDTYSAPDGRMIKREAPYVGEWVSLADYERVANELSDLKSPPTAPAPAPTKAVFHPKPVVHEN